MALVHLLKRFRFQRSEDTEVRSTSKFNSSLTSRFFNLCSNADSN